MNDDVNDHHSYPESSLSRAAAPAAAAVSTLSATPSASHAAHARSDFFTRDLVNQAIAAIPTLGVQQAAEFLASMNVPAEVAIRTLIYKGRRDQF